MSVSIAAVDWDHAAWSGSFYPPDLPPEWRLGYYANEFPAVVLPPERWRAVDAAQVAQWLEDTGPRFRFFVDASAGVAVPAWLLQALGARLGGVLGGVDGCIFERCSGPVAPRALRAALERLASAGGGVLVVDGRPPAHELLRTARTLAELLGL